jgi:adenosine deaminase
MDDRLRALPKVQLHCHLEGTLRASAFRELAKHHGVDIGARGTGPLEEAYAFANFGEFLMLFRDVATVLREPADYGRLAADYAADAHAQGVMYAEVFISPSVWTRLHPQIDVRAVFAAMRAALDEAEARTGLTTRFVCDLTRNFGPARAEQMLEIALAMRDLGVIGIGLGGDEANFPAELFVDVFARAREAGLHVVAHAGEAAGAKSVRAAVELLGAERIGHGVRAIEDPAVVALLAERRIPIEVCPTSNRLTGAAPADLPHPMGALSDAGVIVAIDADDPPLFGTTLVAEYAYVARTLGFATAVRFAANGIDASFADDATKRTLRERFAQARNAGVAGES